MNSLRRIFRPTKEERLSYLKRLLQLHREQIGFCSTCVHLDPGTTFSPDNHGECEVDEPIFARKACEIWTAEPCPQYVESTALVHEIELEIQRIQKKRRGVTHGTE